MKPVVAVEESLGEVAAVLAENGIEVRRVADLGAAAEILKDCQALVVSGLDTNLAGYADIEAPVPVISARGQHPTDVLQDVIARLDLVPPPKEVEVSTGMPPTS